MKERKKEKISERNVEKVKVKRVKCGRGSRAAENQWCGYVRAKSRGSERLRNEKKEVGGGNKKMTMQGGV